MQHSDDFESFDDFDDDLPKSKTRVKQEMHDLQDLGKQLTELSASKLAEVPMDPDLAEAIATMHRIKSREAKRRQLQYIGKLMRKADVEAIEAVLQKHKEQDHLHLRFDRMAEEWRGRLIEQGKEAQSEFFDAYPGADHQQLRNLIRESNKEIATKKAPTNQRKLFRYLRDFFMQEN
ncbi:ribosome biogenesis factor YjgA [Microbulbifer bruguierae]|uniref:Dual-action ribosomal maturation protein DarP n=1 Tax=Microbulbifer bruguierae TaxID=3029061 RepID=A0ABY8NGC6_9GAMM|nr:ribosome biogenesis factor YjgA [Microbulbifer bruguierae]WGL17984.1 ribosome biogenesis factor YjgA [Microbulbifer bruguierae]